ncbi:DUF2236 domain-containing protein [Spongiibacter sp. KMU-158]|uniref:DUF2236 domain-containing protein n=1 Tax=Spongiibacter pelagi TaxID=2760804 RepID=A0A927C1Z6_9GAMM|nr:oxygenase MpaB family protein [Spongiibacter pelagi]MBD2859269.1 DUF2236 domain-containing protein [Spongiibacter pelagi]
MSELTSYLGWKIDFTEPAGEPSFLEPDSIRWRIMKNPITFGIGGICAVLLEFADPRIRSGVWDHSTYKKDPVGRSMRTAMAASISSFGPASVAKSVISRVNKMHANVQGETPDGVAYKALDVELLDWVLATAEYGFHAAYNSFVSPLSQEESDQYYREGHEVGALYGVKQRAESEAGFYKMMEALEPGFEPHAIVKEFLDIVIYSEGRKAPTFMRKWIACAAIDILPTSVRQVLELGPEYDLSRTGRLFVKLIAKLGDKIPNKNSPAAQASIRLGLPANYPWLSQKKQKALVDQLRANGVATSNAALLDAAS